MNVIIFIAMKSILMGTVFLINEGEQFERHLRNSMHYRLGYKEGGSYRALLLSRKRATIVDIPHPYFTVLINLFFPEF